MSAVAINEDVHSDVCEERAEEVDLLVCRTFVAESVPYVVC
jgi:hypothetical protein